jgi:hypothetical protein
MNNKKVIYLAGGNESSMPMRTNTHNSNAPVSSDQGSSQQFQENPQFQDSNVTGNPNVDGDDGDGNFYNVTDSTTSDVSQLTPNATSGEQFPADNMSGMAGGSDGGSDDGSDDGSVMSAGGGSGSGSSISNASINTRELLSVDPMYIRMEEFLTTERKLEGGGGVRKVNVADVLFDISDTLKNLNVAFREHSKVMTRYAEQRQ